MLLLLAVLAATSGVARAQQPAPVDYNRQIKPILANRCYACHGPDTGQRKADLQLHVRDQAVREAIVPGKAAESPLFQRVSSTNPDEQMPPPDSKKPRLSAEEVELVRRWIDAGAKYDAHWAYVKPVRPPLPVVKDPGRVRNPVDQFIAAHHDEQNLTPAPEADRATLIRRLSFDLLGLPPRPEEVAAFLADQRPEAYEELVKRLFASPHYGERMAEYWLDVVRYADTGGYHSDNHRDVWLYRDYVIEAFNKNKPFDRFTIEQLAGDLLPDATRETRIASGYNRLLQTTEEGGAQPKEYTAKYAADRVRNTASAWLGATMGCAECHNHKFDPYTTHDFYQLEAFFADVAETAVGRQPQTAMPSDEQAAEIARLDGEIGPLKAELAKSTPELEAAQAAWEQELKSRRSSWVVLLSNDIRSDGGASFKQLGDGLIMAVAANPDRDTYTVSVATTLKGITGLRLEVLPDDSLPARGPGRAANGNFVLNEVEAALDDAPIRFSAATASHAQNDLAAAGAADGKPETGWAILPQTGKENQLVLETARDVGDGRLATLMVKLHQNYGTSHTLGRFRLSATTAARPVRAETPDALPKEVAAALAVDAAARSDAQKHSLSAYYRTIAPLTQPLREKLAALEKRKDEIVKSAPTTLVSMHVEPRVIRILPRGNWLDDSGEVVLPGVPGFLAPLEAKEGRLSRLDLARWMASRDNPLVARVFVNRLWKLCFGQGIVKTMEDFGTQGAWPTHPELLDWLAVEFMESGWNVEHLLTLMVTSNTYRQSSAAAVGQRERDPANRWLARQHRFRLDAEMVRDNALAVSGLLSEKVGGPSVKPYQPAGYWAHLNFPKREWQNDHGDNQYRRGLYTYWQRTFLHPSLLAFDASTREECTVERPRSNTPLQALVLLNDPTYVEAARVFAVRILQQGGSSPTERAAFALRRAVGREAKPEETAVLVKLYEKQKQEYAADPAAAAQLMQVGEAKPPEGADLTELVAAWTAVARAILNLHETITRY